MAVAVANTASQYAEFSQSNLANYSSSGMIKHLFISEFHHPGTWGMTIEIVTMLDSLLASSTALESIHTQ